MKKTPMRIVGSCVMSAVLAGAFIPAQPLKAYASTHIANSATQSDATQGASAKSDTAVPEAWSVDNFVIEKEGDHAVIKGLSQAGETKRQTCKTLVLPARYDNLDISKIAKEAFKKKEFTSVYMPSSITSIEEKAFFGCKIQELTLSEKLADLGKAAFMMNELTVLEVPASLSTIPENAFAQNKLTSLRLSEGITKIDTRAFYDNNLSDVVIPKSLELVDPHAFEYQHDGDKPEHNATLHTIDTTNPHNLKNSQDHTIITEITETKTLNPNTFTPFSEELSSLQRILDRFYISADGKDVPSKGVRVNKNGTEVERWITPQQKMDTLKLLEKAYEAHFFRTIDEQQVEALNKELADRYLELGKQGETQIGTAPSLEHFSSPGETLKIGVNGWTPLYKKSLFIKYLEVGLRDTTRPNSRLYRLQAIDDTTPTMLRLDFLVPFRNNSHEVPEKYEIECNMPGLAFFKPDDAEYLKHIPQTDLSVIVPDIEDEAHPNHKNVGFGLEPGAVALFNVGENGDTLDNLWQTVVCGYAPNKVPHVSAHEGLAFKGWSLTKPAGVLNDGEDGHIVDPTKAPLSKHTVYYAVYEKAHENTPGGSGGGSASTDTSGGGGSVSTNAYQSTNPEKKATPKEEAPVPTFEQATKRIAGETAEDTMQQIVETAFPDPVKEVVLATSESYWDALSANSLAGSLNAPVLLTKHGKLPEQTIAELKRLKTSKVVVCGGENAISNEVIAQLKALNIEVERVAGQMASDTANDIAKKLAKSDTAVVTTSWGYEDALSAASFAYAKKAPIFLADYNSATLDASNIQTMKDKGVKKVYIVGGKSVVSPEVEAQLSAAGITFERVAGETAYDTSAQLATKLISLGMSANNMAIATGWSYTDALAGAALCGKQNSIMVLADNTNQTAISEVVAANKKSIKNYYIFGGTSAVGENATNALKGVFTGKDDNKDASSEKTAGEQATSAVTSDDKNKAQHVARVLIAM